MEDANIPIVTRKRARLEVRPSHERNPSSTPHTDTQAETIASLAKQLEEQRQQNQAHAKTIAHLEENIVGLENEVYCEQYERCRLEKELSELKSELLDELGERYRLVEEHCELRRELEDGLYELRHELSARGDDVDIVEGKLKRREAEIKQLEEQISELERKLDFETFECKREEIKHEEEIADLEIELVEEREAHRRAKDELEWALKIGR